MELIVKMIYDFFEKILIKLAWLYGYIEGWVRKD
jgi:hypothetical protein